MHGFMPEAWLALIIALYLIWRFFRKRSAEGFEASRSPLNWKHLLEDRIHLLQRLSPEQRQGYHDKVQQFVSKKAFVGCAGLEVTDEMKTLIAGWACLLILRKDAQLFPGVRSILIYPGPFRAAVSAPDENGLVADQPPWMSGESWSGQRVILSWQDVEAALDGGPTNVVVHEFAHQLDDEFPQSEGAPLLPDYQRWAEVMQREFDEHRSQTRPSLLDPYGAENPAEFFSVASETFFQRGAEFSDQHPHLYQLLEDYYGIETH
tara:strand:- start:1074 stop:1862 length:789 start_codon:yes stop_codon:yes gene_type:complete